MVDILPKHLQIDQSFFASCGMYFINYFASLHGDFCESGTQDAEVTKSLQPLTDFIVLGNNLA